MPMRSTSAELSALDASGKSGAHWHHRRYRKARTGKPAAGFSFSQDRPKQFQFVEMVSSHFMQFADGSKMI